MKQTGRWCKPNPPGRARAARGAATLACTRTGYAGEFSPFPGGDAEAAVVLRPVRVVEDDQVTVGASPHAIGEQRAVRAWLDVGTVEIAEKDMARHECHGALPRLAALAADLT